MSRRWILLAALVGLALAGAGTLVARGDDGIVQSESRVATEQNPSGNLPSKQETSQEGRRVFADTLEVRQAVEVNGIVWTLVSYDSSDGPCLDVYADVVPKAAPGQSGCGRPDGPFHWSIGGQELDDGWYNIAYGTAPAGSTSARIETTRGSLTSDVISGTWLSIVPGQSLDYASITLLDANGTTVATAELPSAAAVRQAEASLDSQG